MVNDPVGLQDGTTLLLSVQAARRASADRSHGDGTRVLARATFENRSCDMLL